MKLLYVLPFMRVPPDFGAAIRSYHILNHLACQHSVVLAANTSPDQGMMPNWVEERSMVFESLGPYPAVESPSSGFGQLARRLLAPIPQALARRQPRKLATQLGGILRKYPDVDVVVLETQLMAQAMLYLRTRIPTVAVLLDVYSNYAWRRFAGMARRPYKLVYWLDWLKTYWYERRIVCASPYVVTMSEHDAVSVRALAPRTQVSVSPNGVDTARRLITGRRRSGTLIMVGNFAYIPNADGFFFFARKVLPRVLQAHPESELLVVGLAPTAEMYELGRSDPRIRIVGPVAVTERYYEQAAVAVVPLQLGSGSRLKVLEAFALGVPVVTTSVGVEGIAARHGEHCLIANTSEGFAAAIIGLLDNPSEAARLAGRAMSLAKSQYDWKGIAAAFEALVLRAAASGLDAGRARL